MTALTDTLTRVRAKADQRAASAEAAYRDLVAKCARGATEVAPEKILASLDGWGRDVNEFQDAVEKLATRLDLKVYADAVPALRTRLAAIQSEAAKHQAVHDAEVRAADEKLIAAVAPLDAELATTDAAIKRGVAATDTLIRTAASEVVEARDDAIRAHAAARQSVEALKQGIGHLRNLIGQEQAKQAGLRDNPLFPLGCSPDAGDPHGRQRYDEAGRGRAAGLAECDKRISQHRQQIEERERQLPAARQALADREAEMVAAEAALLIP